jgi:hypothetical protein
MRQFVILVGVLAGFGGAAWASISACATAANGNTFASYGTPSASDGCSEIDKTFTNLSLDSATGTNPITSSDLKIWSSGTSPVGDTMGPVTANFDAAGPPNAWNVSGKNNTQDTVFSYVVTANTGGSFPTPATPGLIWAVDSLQLVVTPQSDANSGVASTVTMNFCLGAVTTAGCGNLGTIVATFTANGAPAYTCSFAGCLSGTSNTVNFSGVTMVAVSQTVHLVNDSTNGHAAGITNIADVWGEGTLVGTVPEPKTFLLVGVPLVIAGLIRRGAKKS